MPSSSRSLLAIAAVTVGIMGTSACRSVLDGPVTDGQAVSASCGIGTRTQDVAPAIRCYITAVSHQDAELSCRMLTDDARAKAARWVSETSPGTCVASAKRGFALINERPADRAKFASLDRQLQIHDLKVHGAQASATLSAGTSRTVQVHLRVEDGGWHFESTGLNS